MKRRICINYADRRFIEAQKNNSRSALETGGFTDVLSFGRSDLDSEFLETYADILENDCGAGFWLWKPYSILRALEMAGGGERLFYCDSGSAFVSPIDPYLDSMTDDVLVFEQHHLEKTWTKRDCFVLMDCDREEMAMSPQRMGGFLLLRRSDRSVDFVRTWLSHCTDPRLLLDRENECGLPNYSGFHAHRHDQSILSLLSKKWNIPAVGDPSQFGNPHRKKGLSQLVDLHRMDD